MKMAMKNYELMVLVAFIAVAVITGTAHAWASPVAGQLGYDMYQRITDITTGPIGVTAGIGLLVYSGYSLATNHITPAIMSLVATGMIAKSGTIVTTLGSTF